MRKQTILCIHAGHNVSVALMHDGLIFGAAQEEHFNRIKNYIGYPKLVNNISDTIRTFENAGLDYLLIEDGILLSKQ